MWTEEKKSQSESSTVAGRDSSKMGDPDLTGQLFQAVQQRNGSAAAVTLPSSTEDPSTTISGIIPGAIAAAVFITFLLALYSVLWKCMVSPPQRKHSKVRVRLKPRSSV